VRVPSYLDVAKSLQDTGEAVYIDHKITPVPFDLAYEVNGPDIDGERYGDLEEALAAIRATVGEPIIAPKVEGCALEYTGQGKEGTPETCRHPDDRLMSYSEDDGHFLACRDCGAIWEVHQGQRNCANCDDPFTPGPQATPATAPYCSAHCYHQAQGQRCPGVCPLCDDNEVP